MNERDFERLDDIREYAERAIRLVRGRSAGDLAGDEAATFAVRYCLLVIGEAANKLTAETRDLLPTIAWRSVIGFRNRLAHGYESIEESVLRDTVANHLPAVVIAVTGMIGSSVEGELQG